MKSKNTLLIFLICILLTPFIVDAYTITLVKNGGTGGTDKINSNNASLPSKIQNLPKKDKNVFKGYYGYTVNKYLKFYDSNGNVVSDRKNTWRKEWDKLYAEWLPITSNIYFVKDRDSCALAISTHSCIEKNGCYDSITNQTREYEMNKKTVKIPTFPEEDNLVFSNYYVDYTQKNENGNKITSRKYYDKNGKIINNKKWYGSKENECLYAETVIDNSKVNKKVDNGQDPLSGGFGVLVELIQYDKNTKAETSVGTPLLIVDSKSTVSGFMREFEETFAGGGNDHSTSPGIENSADRCLKSYDTYEYFTTRHYNQDDIYIQREKDLPLIRIPTINIFVKSNIRYTDLYTYITDEFVPNKLSTLDSITIRFNLNAAHKKNIEVNTDQYYLSFEPVIREKGSIISSKTTENVTTKINMSGSEQWIYSCGAGCVGDDPGGTATSGYGAPGGNCHAQYSCDQKIGGSYEDCEPCSTPCKKENPDGSCAEEGDKECARCWRDWWVPLGYSCRNNTDNDTIFCKGGNKGSWSRGGCVSYMMIERFHHVEIQEYYMTVVKPVRHFGNATIMKSLSTTIDQNESKHENEESGDTEYYVGPELESAIVGECGSKYSGNNCNRNKYNKYSLYDDKNNVYKNFAFNPTNATTTAIGVLYVWLPDTTGCSRECPTTLFPQTSDELLKCAENYCDNLFYYEEGTGFQSQKLKATCISNSCSYTKQQNNCDMKIQDPRVIESIMPGAGSLYRNETEYKSICNYGSNKQISDNNYGYKAYCVQNSATPQNNERSVNLDTLQFVNVLCVEGTACGFMDLSKEVLTKGRRIDYYQKLHLTKKCKIWFDEKSWKFYYASIPSNETMQYSETEITTSRNRMIQLIKDYNDAAKRGYSGSISDSIAEASEVKWEQLNYNLDGISMTLDVDEKIMVNGSETTRTPKPHYELVPLTDPEDKSEPVDKEKLNISDVTDFNGAPAYSYERLNQIPPTSKYNIRSLIPKEYSTSSSYDTVYQIPDMYCIAQDKEATPYNSGGNKTCPDGTLAVHAYFLSLTTKKATFKSTCSKLGVIKNTDTCDPTPDPAFSCDIHVKGNQYCCEEYDGPIDIQLIVHSEPTTKIKVRGIGLYAVKQGDSAPTNDVNNYEEIKNYNPNGKATIVGTIQYGPDDSAKWEKVHCYKDVTVDRCSKNKCNINLDTSYDKQDKTRYTITAKFPFGGGGTEYSAKTSSKSSQFQKLGKESDGKYAFYVTQKEASAHLANPDDNKVFHIIGKVKNTDNSCGLCCKELEYKTEFGRCTSDLQALRKYCRLNYMHDKHCFATYQECIVEYYDSCACPPYSIASNLNKLTTWCNAHYSDYDIWDNESICIQECCKDDMNCVIGSDIIYRPIDNTCPFPYSTEGKGKCQQGDRLIGRNWIGQTHLITDIGDRIYNRKEYEEYAIDLNQDRVRELLEKYAYDSVGNSRYYSYVDGGKQYSSCHDGDNYSGYCSAFIHGSGYFSKIRSILH